MTATTWAGRSGPILVVGALNWDVLARPAMGLVSATSNPGHVDRRAGGVAFNVARQFAAASASVQLAAAVGEDDTGEALLAAVTASGVDASLVQRLPGRSGCYVAVLDASGDLVAGIAEAGPVEALDPAGGEIAAAVRSARLVLAEANLSAAALAGLARLCDAHDVPLVLEAVSVPKAPRLLAAVAVAPLSLLSCNGDELAALAGTPPRDAALRLLAQGVGAVHVTLGAAGAMMVDARGIHAVPAQSHAGADVTGAGDAALAAVVLALLDGASGSAVAEAGQRAAALAMQTSQPKGGR